MLISTIKMWQWNFYYKYRDRLIFQLVLESRTFTRPSCVYAGALKANHCHALAHLGIALKERGAIREFFLMARALNTTWDVP